MEISSTTFANRELAPSRANQGQDNLQRSHENADDARQVHEQSQSTEVSKAEFDKQVRIDIYA